MTRMLTRAMRGRVALSTVLLCSVMPERATAQPLTGGRSASLGVRYESWTFRDGVVQPGFGGADSGRVRGAAQWTVPLATSVALGDRWVADVATAYMSSVLTMAGDSVSPERGRYTLAGLTDVRVRATGRLVGDNLLVTFGATLPTGRTSLDAEEIGVLRVLAAPALGFETPALGTGLGGTAGIVLARELGSWSSAVAVSYEFRGTFQPVAAVTAGIPSLDFDPADAIHLSLGFDRLVGEGRTSINVSTDLFATDRLRQGGSPTAVEVRLGPVFSIDAQWQPAVTRLREFTIYAQDRYRSRFEQMGVPVAGSSGNYLEAGASGLWPAWSSTDVVLGVDLRHHTGLDVDETIATARMASGGVRLGLRREVGGYLIQPLLRMQYGKIRTAEQRVTNAVGTSLGITGGLRF